MARKETIKKAMLLEKAFEITKREGIQGVTARKLAAQLGCSTQPIFRAYASMDELYDEIFQKAAEAFGDYYESFKSDCTLPFVHLGLAYINYAKTERKLFELLFLSEYRKDKGIFELLNYRTMAVSTEINNAVEYGYDNASALFMKTWMFIHGCACMVLTGDYDLDLEETQEFVNDVVQIHMNING